MANILWIQPNQTLALTSIIIDDVTSQEHAKVLQERGDVPSDWVIAGYDVEWPNDGHPHEAYRWVDGKVVADPNYVAPQSPPPTIAQLQTQLTTLQAQITALEGAK